MAENNKNTARSLKCFTNKIIDYAGLFPPASLSLVQAFHNYIFYMQGEYKWMLGKFIIPATRLGELTELMKDMKIEGTIPFSVLGTGGDTVEKFNANLEADTSNITSFISAHGKTVSIDAMEVRLPKDLLAQEDNDDMLDLMISVTDKLEKTLSREIPIFYEASLDETYESIIVRVVESIASLNKGCGYKLRTGGVEASAFPAAEVIAFAIMSCCEFGVPMKCTAGLHHPVRHYNEGVKSYMHGFLNIFGAGILAAVSDFDEEELLEIINDEDPYEFIFKEEGFEWNETEVPNAEITEAREKFMISYGSCSFDEPIDDLKTLELL